VEVFDFYIVCTCNVQFPVLPEQPFRVPGRPATRGHEMILNTEVTRLELSEDFELSEK